MVCMRRPYRWPKPMRYTLLARPMLDVPYMPMGMVSSVGSLHGMLDTHSISSPNAASSR